MKKLVGLFTVFMFACVILSASTVFAGEPYCWFNKWIWLDGEWVNSPVAWVSVPMGEDVHFLFRISVAPPENFGTLYNARVRDQFGAELEMEEPFPISITHGTVSYITKGGSDKVTLTWEIGTLEAGEYAELVFEMSTDINPSDKHQEYTTPSEDCFDLYELNSGATLWFDDARGKQHSGHVDPLMVYVYED